jgi:SMI1 / KNR4 family (SUKH-1)
MNQIKTAIEKYNATCLEIFPDMDGYNTFLELPKATDDEIQALENMLGFSLPDDLKVFYKSFGGLLNQGNDESYCFEIQVITELMRHLQSHEHSKLNSLGLVDMIKFSWGNDRPEFEDELSAEQIKFLNDNYKCFGWYRDDTVLESAWYLYFDTQGSFGQIFYDQDDFEELKADLEQLIAQNTATDTLENLISQALEQIRLTMIEWNE